MKAEREQKSGEIPSSPIEAHLVTEVPMEAECVESSSVVLSACDNMSRDAVLGVRFDVRVG